MCGGNPKGMSCPVHENKFLADKIPKGQKIPNNQRCQNIRCKFNHKAQKALKRKLLHHNHKQTAKKNAKRKEEQ